MKIPVLSQHGKPIRGLLTVAKSSTFEGMFGRMFRTLPSAKFKTEDLKKLAEAMSAEKEDNPKPENELDDEENNGALLPTDPGNRGIDAGYTYLGQFIDHDLTFDPASVLQKQNDPDNIIDFRTPRFDLDCLYGRGPDDQPYLYDSDGLHFLLGDSLTGSSKDTNTRDLPRNQANPQRALIGDPRNDENVIVSQLQGIMLRFHNRMVDYLQSKNPSVTFAEVQQQVRWHYQWVVLNDFLPTIVSKEALFAVLPHLKSGKSITVDTPNRRYFRWRNDPFMPVEFSVAAYRFGHSMVRPIYRLNTQIPRFDIFSHDPATSLVGFRKFPSNWAIDWDLFFNPGNASLVGENRIQKAYKIDTSLVNPLANLPASIGGNIPSLPFRNLQRGADMGLPSGQSVARYMGIKPIPDSDLRVGKANEDDVKTNPKLVDISPNFKDNAPLWYYILAETQQSFKNNGTVLQLGAVGGRIVTEVFIGLLQGDSHSYVSQCPDWKPNKDFLNKNGGFNMIDLIHQAQKA
ncbi:MAG: heme peroxidase family protein [Spirosomataceae bacterium]